MAKRKPKIDPVPILTMPDGRKLDISTMSEEEFEKLREELLSTESGKEFLRELAQPPHCLLLHEPNLSPEVWSTAVMSLILFVADSRGGGAGENSD